MAKKTSKELIKVEPTRELSVIDEFERMVEDFFKWPFSWFPRIRMPEFEMPSPSVDIYEEGDEIVVKSELPGMKKEDIDIKLTEDSVTISGEKKKEEKVERKDYYRLERSYGSFSRSFRLPTEIQIDKAKAQFKDGILEIRIPKSEEAKKKERKLLIE